MPSLVCSFLPETFIEYAVGRSCQVLGVPVGKVLFLRKPIVLGGGDGKEMDKRMTKVINTVKELCKQVL